jgi:hypothetical protein
MGWHAVFPFFVVAYALLAGRDRSFGQSRLPVPRYLAHTAIVATIALATIVILLTTLGERLLPPLMTGSSYESITRPVLLIGWLAHFLALATLIWTTRVRRIIDVWLAVTLVALIIDLSLSALLVTGRYQNGFYLGRAYGFVAALFVLSVLLREAIALYGKAVEGARDTALAQSAAERMPSAASWCWQRKSSDGVSRVSCTTRSASISLRSDSACRRCPTRRRRDPKSSAEAESSGKWSMVSHASSTQSPCACVRER